MKKSISICLIIFCTFCTKLVSAQTQITFYTSMGTFVATMEQTKRPITTKNFIDLVNAKFYDGIIFHRVINNFVIQGGDPTGTGTGGSGVTIVDELTPAFSHLQKTLGMAKTSAPNSATSQFFINLVNNTQLDANYSAFGTVITNFSVVQAIGAVPTTGSSGSPPNKPITNVVMDSLRVTLNPTAVYDMGEIAENMEIFPNPVSDESVMTLVSRSSGMADVSIYTLLGEMVYSGPQYLSEGLNSVSLKEMGVKELAEGMYYLTVKDGSSVSQKKFIRID